MVKENLQNETIARYIREMSPAARAMLAQAMDEAQCVGDNKQQLIADTLYSIMKENGEINAQEMVRRAILEPVEQFIVPEKRDNKITGIIPRYTVDMIWRWIAEELAPDTITQVRNAFTKLAQDAKNDALIDAVQDDIANEIYNALAKVHGQQKQTMRLTSQLGGGAALQDLEEVALLLKHRKIILAIKRNLDGITRLSPEEKQAQLKARLDAIQGKAKEIFPFVLVQAKNILQGLPNFVKFIVFATGSRDADFIERSSYGHAIALMNSDLERIVRRTYTLVQSNDAVAMSEAIKSFGIGLRAIETGLELSTTGKFTKEIKELRSEMASLVWKRLENFSLRLTWLIRPRQGDRTSILILDDGELNTLASDTQILLALRSYAGEFALSAITSRTIGETKEMLENGIPILIERLRTEIGAAQTSIKGRVEGAIRLSELFLGAQYAQVQRRAMELALQNNTKSTHA